MESQQQIDFKLKQKVLGIIATVHLSMIKDQICDNPGSKEKLEQQNSQQQQYQIIEPSESQITNHPQPHPPKQHTRQSAKKYFRVVNPYITTQQQQLDRESVVNFRHTSLKSVIIFLVILIIVLGGVYNIIREVYEIGHPEEMKRVRENARISMVEKGNGVKENNGEKDGVGKGNLGVNGQVEGNKGELPGKEDVGSGQTQNPSLDPTDHSGSQSTGLNSQQTLSQEQQGKASLTQSQNVNVHFSSAQNELKEEKSKKSEAESALRQREQFIESFGKGQGNKQVQIPLKSDGKIDFLKMEKELHSPNRLKTIEKQAELIEPINQNRAGQANPANPSPQTQSFSSYFKGNSQVATPASKAGISQQQAIKWRQYQQMLQLPLDLQISQNPMLIQQYTYFQSKYNISQFQQLPICVVVPSYNNIQDDRYKANLKSIIMQNYSNYHVVFIDDVSQDGTGQKVQEYADSLQAKYRERIKVIINKERKMAMPNLRYAAMNQCEENELFIIVDGDDSLIGRQVFKLFSAVMQQKDLWVMYSNFLSPKGAIGYSRQYAPVARKSNNYRKAGFVMSHLRAYYTKLFRLVKQQDLKDQNGEYYHAANDVAIGIPVLQMAHEHVGYVPQLSYYYNMNTGLNNHKVRLKEQKSNDKKIRLKKPYEALDSLWFDTVLKNKQSQAQQALANDQKQQNLAQTPQKK